MQLANVFFNKKKKETQISHGVESIKVLSPFRHNKANTTSIEHRISSNKFITRFPNQVVDLRPENEWKHVSHP